MTWRFSLVILLVVGVISVARAGSEPDGYSSVDGYFLGFGTEAYLSTRNSKAYVQEIESICKRQGQFWALGVKSAFTCTGFSYIEEGGNGPVYGLNLKSSVQLKPLTHAILFSTKPFPSPHWSQRAASKAEIENLLTTTPLASKKYSMALKNAKAGKVKIIESAGKATIFVIPWRVTSDGLVEEEETLLLITSGNTEAYEAKEIRGRIVGLADINGDGIPEFQVSIACDGTCESVVSVVSENRVRVYISNH